jgi:hypothetical protein
MFVLLVECLMIHMSCLYLAYPGHILCMKLHLLANSILFCSWHSKHLTGNYTPLAVKLRRLAQYRAYVYIIEIQSDFWLMLII